MSQPDFSALLAQLRSLIGENHVRTGEAAKPFHTDERNRYHRAPLAVALPENVEQISQIVRLCAAHTPKIALIAQGGNTGLVGGCAVLEHTPSLILNLTRLNRIIALDTQNQTMTVQAGVTLAQVQQHAAAHDLLFPLSLASEDSATIGGNLATNAGGTQVLRYGTMRELCLGLEVVLADGQVLSELNTLRKNNTGYDLKQLFIGAEGTLGIITAAVLKLYPQPVRRQVALIGATDLPRLMQAFDRLRQRFDANLTAFELISPYAMQLVCDHLRCAHPWAHTPNLYSALIELSQTHNDDDAQSCLMPLNELLEQNLIEQAIVADSLTQAEHLWRLREQISAAQKAVGKNVKHDVSVPISAIATFIAATEAALEAAYPGIQTVVFGHMGDGNVHFNVSAGAAFANADELMAHEEAINTIVYQQVEHHHGSISAEHGIGLLKKARMFDIKTPVELHLMRALKHTLDPHNLMNPHKVLPD